MLREAEVWSLVFLVANKLVQSADYFTGYILKVCDAVYTLGVILTTANFESGADEKRRRRRKEKG